MTTITPTLSNQRWGPDAHHIFDYAANATRVTGGNPLIIYRYAGGATQGDQTGVWDQVNGAESYMYNYFLTNAGLAEKFDMVSVVTGQRSISSTVIRCKQMFILDDVRELQVAIAEIKRLGKIGFGASNQYKINPNKVVVAGASFGATLAMLSQLFPPYIGNGAQITNMHRPTIGGGFSSQCRGVLNHIGQIDARTIAGVDQQMFSNLFGWFGTSGNNPNDGGVEFSAFPNDIKAAASVRAYIQNGDTQYYRPIYNMYVNTGLGHTHPYSDAHDAQQLIELKADLNAAGLLHGASLYQPTDLGQASGTGPRAIALYNAVYNFLAARINSTEVLSSLPVP